MRIAVLIDLGHARHWHRRLVEALRQDGHEVRVVPAAEATEPTSRHEGLVLLQAIERRLHRGAADHAGAALTPAEAASLASGNAAAGQVDLSIDLTGHGAAGAVLAPVVEGFHAGPLGAAAILAGEAPVVGATYRPADDAPQRCIALAYPAIEDPDILVLATDQVAIGVVRLLRQCVRRIAAGEPLPACDADPAQAEPAAPASVARFIGRTLARTVRSRRTRLTARPNHWRVGWRRIESDGVDERLAWPAAPYRFILDDATRFLADPFVFVQDGLAYVFCEDRPYATKKGVISYVVIAGDGTVSAPRVALERPYHLSYPFVFAEDGAVWMIPETSANGGIELYRAERFPDAWVRERVLVENVVVADATLVEHAGRRWLFAATAGDGGSLWDCLSLFHAPGLLGPWQPHPLNPVLIDVRAARPAGAMFEREGRLLRPAQDCTDGYGSALTLCEVLRLDPGGYEQRIVARLPPRPEWRAKGTHTLNQGGGYEVIDCVSPRTRLP